MKLEKIFTALISRKEILLRNKWLVIVIVVLITLFYWFQVRPILIAKKCTEIAKLNAQDLLKKKAKVTDDYSSRIQYEKYAKEGLHLRDDYESYYRQCLRQYGIIRE